MTGLPRHAPLTLALACLASSGLAQDTQPAPERLELRLDIVVENGELRGFSYSSAAGPHVATAGVLTHQGAASGAIASTGPVWVSPDGDEGFGLYASPVGQAQ